jgi:plasmid stabilization system protein ParE
MRRIVIAPSFDAEFLDISTYIELEFGLRAADEFEDRFRRLALALAHSPMIGTKEHGYPTTLYGVVFSPNWVFYRFTDDEVQFLHIRDGRRDKGRQRF